jgi:DNA-binding winged helix-turn-helix (wHTH) protein/tetratricopeptide (TPR) repeat protein
VTELQQEIVYRFDGFCLNVARGTLSGPDGSELALRPKAFALLRYFLEHPNRLHRREELFEVLWPGVVVTDDSLTQCVSDLRRLFGDRANQILRTLPRRGYVLAAEVERNMSGSDRSSGSVTEAPAPVPPRIASSAEEDRYALILMERPQAPQGAGSIGIASEFLNELFMRLARFEDLQVVAATAEQPAEAYRVRSDVRVVGEVIRASILLEDAGTGAVLWGEQYDEPLADIASLTKTLIVPLSHRIARQTEAESLRRARRKSTTSLNARELCLLASDHHRWGTEADTVIARNLLDRAISLDASYAPAYAWLAYTAQRGFTYGWGSLDANEARKQALALARHAVALAPDSPLCLSRLAFSLLLHNRWDEAVDTARMALSGTCPADFNVRVTCSVVLIHGGFTQEAVELMQCTRRLDPHCPPTVHFSLGRALLMAGRPEEALPELRICASRLPDFAPCYDSLLVAAHETGHVEEAQHALEQLNRLHPDWQARNGTGQWFFRNAEDAARFQRAYHEVQGSVIRDHGPSAADVLTFPAKHIGK